MHFCLSASHCPLCPDGMKLAQVFLFFFLFYLFFCSSCNTKSKYDVRKLKSFLCVWSNRVHSLNIKHTKAGCNFSILSSVLFREDWDGGKAEVCQSRRAKQWDHPASFERGSVTEVPHILHHATPSSFTNHHPLSILLHIHHNLTQIPGWNYHCIRKRACEWSALMPQHHSDPMVKSRFLWPLRAVGSSAGIHLEKEENADNAAWISECTDWSPGSIERSGFSHIRSLTTVLG